jgi:hypothetical protein
MKEVEKEAVGVCETLRRFLRAEHLTVTHAKEGRRKIFKLKFGSGP